MNLLITGASVIPMTDGAVLADTDIAVSDGKIAAIGEIPQGMTFDRTIDGRGFVVMPALTNTHVHSPMGFLRGCGEGLPLQRWLNEKVFPAEDKLTEQDMYTLTLLGIAEMVSTGTGLFNDMYFFTHKSAEAVIDAKTRACLTYCATDIGNNAEDITTLRAVQNNRRLFADYHGYDDDRIRVSVSPHAIYTCSERLLRFCAEEAARLDTFVYTHLSETVGENADCLTARGVTPTAYLNNIGFFDVPATLAHCVHLSDEDRAILAEHGASVATCPESNLKLGSGICEADKLFANGINVAIGTDGASSNNNLNMFEEMHLFSLLLKGVRQDASLLSPEQVLQCATINGARAMGLSHRTGTLEVGKDADLILVDTQKPHMSPIHNLCSNLVYAAQGSDVYLTMVKGEILYENGQWLTIDVERVKHDTAAICNRIF